MNEDRVHRRFRHAQEPRRRNPQHRGGRRDRQDRARLQQGGADPGISARQGAAESRAPAVSRPDPARRRARADPARRRRGAARARRRAGRHARHQGCRRRRGAAAQVHRELRDGAADRSGRLRDASRLTQPGRRQSRTARWNRRCRSCASGRRGTSRSRTAAWRRATRWSLDLERTAAGDDGDAADRQARGGQRRHRRAGQPARDSTRR